MGWGDAGVDAVAGRDGDAARGHHGDLAAHVDEQPHALLEVVGHVHVWADASMRGGKG